MASAGKLTRTSPFGNVTLTSGPGTITSGASVVGLAHEYDALNASATVVVDATLLTNVTLAVPSIAGFTTQIISATAQSSGGGICLTHITSGGSVVFTPVLLGSHNVTIILRYIRNVST